MKFSQKDIAQIKEKGLSLKGIEDQIAIFKRGNKAVKIVAAATLGNGIRQVDNKQADKLICIFEDLKHNLKLLNFIPASGAETRMFKELYVFVENFDPDKDSLQKYFRRNESKKLERFISELHKLPFYEETLSLAKKNFPEFKNSTTDIQKYYLLRSSMLKP